MAKSSATARNDGPELPMYMRDSMKGRATSGSQSHTIKNTSTGTRKTQPQRRADSGRKSSTQPAPHTATARQSATRQGAAQQGSTRQSTARQSATQQSAARQSAARQSAARQSAARQSAARQSTAQKSSSQASAARRSGNGSSGRKKNRRGSGSPVKILILIMLLLLAVILFVFLLGDKGGSAEAPDLSGILSSKKTYKDGVKLVGVDVSGLTPEEATGLVKNAAEKELRSVAITVKALESSWTLDYMALGMDYSIEQTLADGLSYGISNSSTQDIEGPGAGEYDAEYTWSREGLELALSSIANSVAVPATDAYASPITDWESEERFDYLSGEEGRSLNIEDTVDAIEYALRTHNFTAEIDAVLNAVLPTGSIDDIKANTVLIASYTTKFSAARSDETKQNRKFNIQKAADIINGNTVLPDEQWSFNTVVGPRTYDLGWKGANGISGGKEYTIQAGGGICQVSTTLYNALLGANMQILDRRAHTIPSDYVAVGLDATVDTRGIDFVWKNNTAFPVYIFARVQPVEGSSSRNTLTVYVYGTPLPEGVTYSSRSEITETVERTDTVFIDDASIPTGYQLEKIVTHNAYKADAYLDKYVNGELKESTKLYSDEYKGNPAEIHIGTGAPLEAGATVPEGLQPVGTAPTAAAKR